MCYMSQQSYEYENGKRDGFDKGVARERERVKDGVRKYFKSFENVDRIKCGCGCGRYIEFSHGVLQRVEKSIIDMIDRGGV